MRERLQPAAGASNLTPKRNGRTRLARRTEIATDSATADRELAAGNFRRRRWYRTRLCRAKSHHRHCASRNYSRRGGDRDEYASPAVYLRHLDIDCAPVRLGAGVARVDSGARVRIEEPRQQRLEQS